jgi:hypothetical protein
VAQKDRETFPRSIQYLKSIVSRQSNQNWKEIWSKNQRWELFQIKNDQSKVLKVAQIADIRQVMGMATGHSGIFLSYVRKMGFPDSDIVQCPCGLRDADPEHYLLHCPMFRVFIRQQLGNEIPASYPNFFHNISLKVLQLFRHLYLMIGAHHRVLVHSSRFDTPAPSEDSSVFECSDHG